MLPKGWYKEHADFIPEEEKHTVTFADAEKSLWKAWLKEKKAPSHNTHRGSTWHTGDEDSCPTCGTKKKPEYDNEKVEANTSDSNKAEEGPGGMSMGAQRGLGHEAGYKQDPGQSAQITEVPEEEEGEGEKTAKQVVGGGGIQEGLHLIGLSAYETSEQGSNESTDVEPNKRQAPASKPGTDTFKSLYKKALITKYNNIYKPANI
jgi:hypothetical protein